MAASTYLFVRFSFAKRNSRLLHNIQISMENSKCVRGFKLYMDFGTAIMVMR